MDLLNNVASIEVGKFKIDFGKDIYVYENNDRIGRYKYSSLNIVTK